MHRCVAALAAIAFATSAHAQTVTVARGNVQIDRDGVTQQLTSLGRDEDAVLSPDRRFVVFTRKSTKAAETDDCQDGDQLMRINADGTGETTLLRGRRADKPEQQLCVFAAKQFNSDGRLLYFLSPAWATSWALHVYDFRTRTDSFVVDANGLHVLSACRDEHKDRVAVQRHKYFVFGGSYDWYWLYDPATKKEIGPLGEIEDKDLAKEAEGWCR